MRWPKTARGDDCSGAGCHGDDSGRAFGPIPWCETIGQIMGVMPIVVIAVLIASLIECFFILPGHLAHTLQPRRKLVPLAPPLLSLLAGVFVIAVVTRTSGGGAEVLAPGFFGTLAAFKAENSTPVFLAMIRHRFDGVWSVDRGAALGHEQDSSRRRKASQNLNLEA